MRGVLFQLKLGVEGAIYTWMGQQHHIFMKAGALGGLALSTGKGI